MDPSKSLPGFSFTSGALRAVTACKNLCKFYSPMIFLIDMMYKSWWSLLSVTCMCRFIVKSCRVSNS